MELTRSEYVVGAVWYGVLGEKWLEAVPVIELLGFAMPFMTMQVLFGPAVSAIGKPEVYFRLCVIGAFVMTIAYFCGIRVNLMHPPKRSRRTRLKSIASHSIRSIPL